MRRDSRMAALAFGAFMITAFAPACTGKPAAQRAPTVAAPEAARVLAIERKPRPIADLVAGKTGIIQMIVTDRGFEPSLIRAREGGRVRIYLRNQGTTEHNLVIPRFGIVTSPMPSGSVNFIEFTAAEKGAWPFFSDAPGQPERGLDGTLKVE